MKKVAVITGGAGGMGLATAKLLGQDHHLVICDMSEERLKAAEAQLQESGTSSDSVVCDVTDRESIKLLVDKARGLGSISCVVHTAGLSPQMAEPEVILKVNALGTVNIAEAFYDVAEEGFALVNVASMAAHMFPGLMAPKKAYRLAQSAPDAFLRKTVFRCRLLPNDFYRRGMAYSMSKDFVIWYSKHSAARFGEKGARILSVSPGTFDTEMGRLEEKSGSMEMLKQAALKRVGRPEEIAAVLAFFASDKASYVTGVDILCDGGVVASKEK